MDTTILVKREAGVAMLEVLVAILVLSFGLLGVAGMQIVGMRSANTAHQRSVATFQSYDIADRMRANMAEVANTTAACNADPADCEFFDCATAPAIPTCATNFGSSGASPCSASDIKSYDTAVWCTTNSQLLPGGTGTVSAISGSNAYAVTVSWTEKCQTGETGCTSGILTRSFVTQVVP